MQKSVKHGQSIDQVDVFLVELMRVVLFWWNVHNKWMKIWF